MKLLSVTRSKNKLALSFQRHTGVPSLASPWSPCSAGNRGTTNVSTKRRQKPRSSSPGTSPSFPMNPPAPPHPAARPAPSAPVSMPTNTASPVRSTVLTAAEQTAFDAHCKSICEALVPRRRSPEIDIAQAIAEDRWRLKRAPRHRSRYLSPPAGEGLLGFNPGNPQRGAQREDPAQVLIEDTLNKTCARLAKNDNFTASPLSTSSASNARDRRRNIGRNSAPCGPKRKAARESSAQKKPCTALPTRTEAKAKKVRSGVRFHAPSLREINSDFSVAAIPLLIARTQRLNEARDYAKTRANPNSGRQMPAAA